MTNSHGSSSLREDTQSTAETFVLASANIDHDAVYEEVLVTLETAAKTIGKNVCDELYGGLLDAVQDYLKDNVRFNIASILATAERERHSSWERAEAAERKAGILLDATRTGAIWFEEYALLHSSKGTEEGNDKAERNLVRARQLRAAIDRATTASSVGTEAEGRSEPKTPPETGTGTGTEDGR